MAQVTERVENKKTEHELPNENNYLHVNQASSNQKTKFQLECERGVSIEEARQHTHEFIKQLWKK